MLIHFDDDCSTTQAGTQWKAGKVMDVNQKQMEANFITN